MKLQPKPSKIRCEEEAVKRYPPPSIFMVAVSYFAGCIRLAINRFDSVRVSEEADAAAKEFVRKNYGEELVTTQDVNKVSGKKIQDAHEAIRPTYVELTIVVMVGA